MFTSTTGRAPRLSARPRLRRITTVLTAAAGGMLASGRRRSGRLRRDHPGPQRRRDTAPALPRPRLPRPRRSSPAGCPAGRSP